MSIMRKQCTLPQYLKNKRKKWSKFAGDAKIKFRDEFFYIFAPTLVRGGAVVARRAHNPKVVGSSPAPATRD